MVPDLGPVGNRIAPNVFTAGVALAYNRMFGDGDYYVGDALLDAIPTSMGGLKLGTENYNARVAARGQTPKTGMEGGLGPEDRGKPRKRRGIPQKLKRDATGLVMQGQRPRFDRQDMKEWAEHYEAELAREGTPRDNALKKAVHREP